MALLRVDELDLAAVAIERALAHARRSGSLMALGTATHWRTELLYYQGQLAEAVSAAEQTLDICRAGCDLCVPWVVPVLAEAHLDRGELDAARQALDLLDGFPTERPEHTLALTARGRLALAHEDPAAALRDLRAAGDLAGRHGMTQPTMLPWRIWASTAATQLGNRRARPGTRPHGARTRPGRRRAQDTRRGPARRRTSRRRQAGRGTAH